MIKRNIYLINLLNVLICIFAFLSTYFMIEIINLPSANIITFFSIAMVLEIISLLFMQYIKKQTLTYMKIEHDKKIIEAIKNKDILYMESPDYENKIAEIKVSDDHNRLKVEGISAIVIGLSYLAGLSILLQSKIPWIYIILNLSITVIFIICSFYTSNKISKTMYEFWKNYRENTRLYNAYSDVLIKKEYMLEKKIFAHLNYFTNKFNIEFDKASSLNREAGKRRLILEIMSDFIYFMFFFFQITFLVLMLHYNMISLGFLIAVFPFTITCFTKMNNAFLAVNDLVQVKCFEKSVDEFTKEKFENRKVKNVICDDEVALNLKGITFIYPNSNKKIIDDITYVFEKGKRYAIVGENGSGKTTLVKLIAGLYTPCSGTIETNGEIRVLFQSYNRYALTVEENVTVNECSDENQVNEILQKVGLKNKIGTMKNGINTELSNLKDGGENLSGGQWQRLALARVLYQNADIVILDEPTASLDPLVEKEIYDNYLNLFSNKTIIMITHRLGFIKDFDDILTVKDGKIIEHGKHENLMNEKKSFYRKMFEEQRKMYEE